MPAPAETMGFNLETMEHVLGSDASILQIEKLRHEGEGDLPREVVAESRPESGLLMPNPGIIPLWSPMC
jgi:hypothetical protein